MFPRRTWSIPWSLRRVLLVLMLSLETIGMLMVSFSFLVSRRIICLELIKEKHPASKRLRTFWMCVYCFPDPSSAAQKLAIRSIGSVENEMQSTYCKMSDADRLITCKRNRIDAEETLKLKGEIDWFSSNILGQALEAHLGQILGLTKKNTKDPSGTVKTM